MGEGNLIQDISAPTKCPNYYETPQYQHQQKMVLKEKTDKERIKLLEGALKGTTMMISSQQITIKSIESDLSLAREGITYKGQLSVAEYEQKLNAAKAELERLKRDKSNYENELNQLNSMQYR